MHRLRSFYNRNKRTIFIVMFCIIVGYMIIKFLNYYYIEKAKNMQKTYNGSSSIQNTTTVIENQGFDLSKNKKSVKTIKEDKSIIDEFFDFCNENKVLEAYNLITDECKQARFPTLEEFKNSYYNTIFNTTKSYTIQNWNGKTYRIKLQEDVLSTGKIGNDTFIEDYITIVDTNNTKKLNISNYIKKVDIFKSLENETTKITINSKDVYMDYEIYNITVKNNTDSKLLIDDLQKTDSIYLTENKGGKYPFVNYELTKEQLEIMPKEEINVAIKFNHTYRNDKLIKSMTFSGIQKEKNGKMDSIIINMQ